MPEDLKVPVPDKTSWFKWAGLVVAIILAVTGGILVLRRKKLTMSTGQVNIENLRKAFTPALSNHPTQSSGQIGNATSTDVAVISPYALSTANILPQSRSTTTPLAPPPAPPKIYKNIVLGFQVEINDVWQANEQGDTVVFTNASGQNISIQTFNAIGEDLDVIQTQLQGSPSVRNITRTIFKREPALNFLTAKGQGIAVIHQNRIFYIMASDLSTEPISSFVFQN